MNPTVPRDPPGADVQHLRLVPPSPELKERVLGAAKEAWLAPHAEEVSARSPLLQLAACLFLAAIPVFVPKLLIPGPADRVSHELHDSNRPVHVSPTAWDVTGRPPRPHRLGDLVPSLPLSRIDLLRNHKQTIVALLRDVLPNEG